MSSRYESFAQFYPFYLSEHSTTGCRRLHFIGSALVLISFVLFFSSMNWRWIVAMPVFGYGFAWIGHFFFERNRPATFEYPIYSLMGDWVMFRDIIVGKQKLW